MEEIDQLLAVKTRLTTISGYAQLIEREVSQLEPQPERLNARIQELNREIRRLVSLVGSIEATTLEPGMTDRHLADHSGDEPMTRAD